MIFGQNHKTVNPSGKQYFWNDGTIQNHCGGQIYEGGNITNVGDNVMWTKNGTAAHSGNIYWTHDGVYNKSGNILHGPNGQMWTGVNSNRDIQSIISHNLNKG